RRCQRGRVVRDVSGQAVGLGGRLRASPARKGRGRPAPVSAGRGPPAAGAEPPGAPLARGRAGPLRARGGAAGARAGRGRRGGAPGGGAAGRGGAGGPRVSTKPARRAGLESGAFAVTAEIGPPRKTDPEALRRKVAPLAGWVDAINITDNAGAQVRMT